MFGKKLSSAAWNGPAGSTCWQAHATERCTSASPPTLQKRVWEHQEGFVEGFTKRYDVDRLVWYEGHASAYDAISREKQLKNWNRAWKIQLIEAMNPYWNDLSDEIC